MIDIEMVRVVYPAEKAGKGGAKKSKPKPKPKRLVPAARNRWKRQG